MDWKPLYDKIIVKRAPKKTEFAEGIAAPDKYQSDQNLGVVVRTGNGRWIDGVLYPLTVSPGDLVLFSKHAGVELEDVEPDLLILREDELLAWQRPPAEKKEAA